MRALQPQRLQPRHRFRWLGQGCEGETLSSSFIKMMLYHNICYFRELISLHETTFYHQDL